jgi:hypothetical protein
MFQLYTTNTVNYITTPRIGNSKQTGNTHQTEKLKRIENKFPIEKSKRTGNTHQTEKSKRTEKHKQGDKTNVTEKRTTIDVHTIPHTQCTEEEEVEFEIIPFYDYDEYILV